MNFPDGLRGIAKKSQVNIAYSPTLEVGFPVVLLGN